MELTAERVRELLDYDPDTGIFVWRKNRSNVRAGSEAGTVKPEGNNCVYRIIQIDGRLLRAHRLARAVDGEQSRGHDDDDNRSFLKCSWKLANGLATILTILTAMG